MCAVNLRHPFHDHGGKYVKIFTITFKGLLLDIQRALIRLKVDVQA